MKFIAVGDRILPVSIVADHLTLLPVYAAFIRYVLATYVYPSSIRTEETERAVGYDWWARWRWSAEHDRSK